MNVLLLNPPRDHEIIGNNPSIIEEERGYNPPLGLLYIAAYLERHSTHAITVVDAQVEELDYRGLTRRIREINPDIIGLTVMTMTLIDVMNVVALIKQLRADTRVVLGGPHVHLFPEETINLPGVDYLVLGEGEKTFATLLEHFDDPDYLSTVSGLVFKYKEHIISTGNPAFIEDLDELPLPARHLVPYKKYRSLLSKGGTVTTIFSSRGCPFQCAFCDRPHLGKRFRYRSAVNVVNELEACVAMGIREFLFYDDTFTVNKPRVIDICQEIIARKLDISWDIRTRVDSITEEMLQSLKRAGCHGIHYGVEAGTEKILRVLNKGISLDQVRETFAMTRKYRIPILAYFMIGCPSETREDILTTFEVMKNLRPDFVHLTIFTPFPGTQLYADGLQRGIITRDVWREFATHPTPGFVAPYWQEFLGKEELQDLLVQGYKGFYQRPSYILKRLFSIKSWAEFRQKSRAGLKVFSMTSSNPKT